MKTKNIIITSMAIFALLIGVFLALPSMVSAQAETASQAKGSHDWGDNLENVAEALGITVEELQEAFQNARPAECADLELTERPAAGINCRPNLEAVASELGITVEELNAAFEAARQQAQAERLASAAEQLGVSVEALQSALENARPVECADLTPQEARESGTNCRVDLETVADELGITTEELQSALGKGARSGNLEAVAETLGVTTEALRQAFQSARPAECAAGEKPEGVNCRPNLETVAETLGVDVEELRTALQNERGGRRGHGRANGEGGQP
jgi:DNA-binding phage protein